MQKTNDKKKVNVQQPFLKALDSLIKLTITKQLFRVQGLVKNYFYPSIDNSKKHVLLELSQTPEATGQNAPTTKNAPTFFQNKSLEKNFVLLFKCL